MSYIRKKTIEGLKSGDKFCISRTFTKQDMLNFADITKDFNPVHFDKRFAQVKKFDDCICHGLLIGGMLTEIGGQIGWLASEIHFCFKKPVYFGDTITCCLTIIKIDERGRAKAQVLYKNQHDVLVLEAELSGIIPQSKEKEILSAMISEGDITNKLK
ncbi:MAG: MaoC family dehydratase [Desulfobacterales bacterium]|nr:MaoC family dehydratase [Desulfobacterales bacterium]